MNWTIGKKVTAAGGAILLLSVGTAGLGLKMNADLGDALDRATVSASILRNHMQADMMHDALRSDVFGALLSSDPANGVDPAEMKAGLKEHRETFEAAVAENTRLATDPELKAALLEVEAPLRTYVQAAGQMVDLAETDPAAAQRRMAEFQDQFGVLETAMGAAAGRILHFRHDIVGPRIQRQVRAPRPGLRQPAGAGQFRERVKRTLFPEREQQHQPLAGLADGVQGGAYRAVLMDGEGAGAAPRERYVPARPRWRALVLVAALFLWGFSLRGDEAIAEADTILLTIPNQLGVAYNAHVMESLLTTVAPALGWR